MAEKIEVNPTPIQRNKFDVAMELLELHERNFGIKSEDEISNLFAKYYSAVQILSSPNVNTHKEFAPDSFKELLKN